MTALADIALVWGNGSADMAIVDDDIATDDGLETAVLLSIGLDRRAEDDDVLPGGDDDRRGWWADEFAEVENDRIGSRRWLLERSARREDVVPRLKEYDREALAWMIEDRVASAVDIEAELAGDRLLEAITIHRPGREPVTFRYWHVWDALEGAV